jgi:BirA family biotin operon repressor/biotin-[acetyl-CoA-carboxylase] ligase
MADEINLLPLIMTESIDAAFPALDWQAIARACAHGRLGRRVVYHASIGSTNALARALLRDGALDGTVVLADEQTQGRGRLGRRWVAPARSGLAISVCLRPASSTHLPAFSMAAPLAAGDVVRGLVGPRCTLKWPNDVRVDGAKLCGILLELEQLGGSWGVVVGIGLNVNAAPDLPGASSLAAAIGAPLPREPLAIDLLAVLERYVALAEDQPQVLLQLWRDRLETLGQRVSAQGPDGVLHGLAEDVDAEGALLLRQDDGTLRAVHAGDVTLAAN